MHCVFQTLAQSQVRAHIAASYGRYRYPTRTSQHFRSPRPFSSRFAVAQSSQGDLASCRTQVLVIWTHRAARGTGGRRIPTCDVVLIV